MRYIRLLVLGLIPILVLSLSITGCDGGGGGGSSDSGFSGIATFTNPNLNVEILSINIGSDRRPAVTFIAVDDNDFMIPLNAFNDARFILAVLERTSVGAAFQYRSYSTQIETAPGDIEATQASYDSARQADIIVNDNGTFTYKFDTVLPAGYDPSATHQLGGQLRYVSGTDGKTYRANIAFTFRPDGLPVTRTREIVTTQSCNQCHTRLSVHGDMRREVQLCILCHSSQTIDAETGNNLQFAEMIHKIHRGADLPSFAIDAEPYQISGFGNSIHDYSTVHYPQDVRNCSSCHEDASQGSFHETAPTLEGCMSCHDRTWFGAIDETPTSFTNHLGGEHADNSLCALCHSPEGNGVSLVSTAHVLPTESSDAPGLDLVVTSVNTFAGISDTGVTVTFSAENGDGSPVTSLAALNSVAATIAYPATDYETYVREGIAPTTSGILVNNGRGSYSYTFAAELPTGSTDTFAVAMEGRRNFTFRGQTLRQGTAGNGLLFFTLDASPPLERRAVINDAKCSTCHQEIRMHGESRTGIEYCIMCHNPNTTDEGRRPLAQMPPVSVNFKDMIHKIHSGEDLTQDYTVYGFGGVAHDFNEVRFPGLRQDCSICHEEDTMNIPLPDEALSTIVTQSNVLLSEILPTRAACTSCHDTTSANSHALGQTFGGVESCAVCHSESDDDAVSLVHALSP